MTYRTINWVRGLAAVTLLAALPAVALAGAIWLRCGLEAPPGVTGRGFVDYRTDGVDNRLRLRVWGLASLNLDSVDVFIDEQYLASFDLNDRGHGKLHLSTRHGDDVPYLREGDVVAIRDPNTGGTLLKGQLQRVR